MLDSSRNDNPIRFQTRKLDGVANVVAPKSGIGRKNQHIIHAQFDFANGVSFRVFGIKLVAFDEFVENSGVQQQQHSFFLLGILIGKKSFRSGKQFDAVHFSSNQIFEFGTIRFIIDAAINKQIEVFEDFAHRLFSFLRKLFKIHLHPRRNPRNHCHILVESFLDNGVYLGFPIFDAIGFPRRHSVFLQVFRNKMRHDSRQSSQFHAIFFFQNGTSLQENHFPVDKIGVSGFVNVMQNGVSCRFDMKGHRFFGQRNVFGSRSRSRSFGKIEWFAFPEHVLLAFHDFVNV